MKKWISILLVVFLLTPTIAWTEEGRELVSPAPTGEPTEAVNQVETTPTMEATVTPVFSIELFGYAIVVSEIDGLTSVGLLKKGEDSSYESLVLYEMGGVLGKAVSSVAKIVAPGPAHGKVVSTFVRTVNQQRKERKMEEIKERKEEIERVRNQRRENKEFGKKNKGSDKFQELFQELRGKGKGKGKGSEQGREEGNRLNEQELTE